MPLLLHTQHVLCRRRFVIHVESVDVRPTIEKEFGNLNRRCEVQRHLSVSTSCVDNVRVRRDQLAEFCHHSEPGSSVRVDHRAALDQKIHQARIAIVEHAKSTRPPFGSLADVGASAEKDIDSRPVAPLHRGEQSMFPKAVVWQRLVDPGSYLWMTPEKFPDTLSIAIAYSNFQGLGRRKAQGDDVRFQACPGAETILSG